jgi:DNA-binding MarR family transcriptional regulator/catechol 2,3-dioxygenase-like lactoylglutathione lyase family enzyme
LTNKELVDIVTSMRGPKMEEFPTPTLMRMARGTYAQAIRAELHALGCHDLPRNGVFVLTALEASEESRPELPAELGVTKQAVSLVIDTLVTRGYLERRPGTTDRRRVDLELTDRGQEVVDTAARAVEAIDHQLEERLSREQIGATRAALIAMIEIKTNALAGGTGKRPAPRELRRLCPIFPVRDLEAALAHYRLLGFTVASEPGDDYGFANRDGVELHLAQHTTNEPSGPGSAYLYVRGADALFQEWNRPNIAGHTHPVEATTYGLLEGSHVDPDGNLIRFGSPIEG